VRLLNLTFESPEKNLALDEALLDEAEHADDSQEVLRLWEPQRPMVVVGRSSRVSAEVNETFCRKSEIPIFRRSSGGAAVVSGPGCIMYALVLSYRQRSDLRALDAAHRAVMGRMRDALASHVPDVEFQGTCDLTLAGRKFSGNSMRCRREHFLYHGTVLYDFPLALIAECLRMPGRMPDYRSARPHESFVTNLPLDRAAIIKSIVEAWKADESLETPPHERVADLVRDKYAQDEWNRKL
jgi:lipoate-protein ligase A